MATPYVEEPQNHISSGHLLALDGVRGLAILMVVGSHAFESNYDSGATMVRFIGHFLYFGFFGVDLFFVLSGFLITGILFDSLQDTGYFRKFYIRRALRIFPLYYGTLGVCFLLTWPLHLHWGDMGWLLVFYLQNLHPMKIMSYSPGPPIALYHFWSLAVEEQFYLVWPAVIYLVRGKQRLFLLMLAASFGALLLRIGLLACGASSFAMHVTTICRADSLLLGGALSILYRSNRWLSVQRVALWGFIGSAVLIGASIFVLQPFLTQYPLASAMWSEGFRFTVLAIGFASLIAWSLRFGTVCRWIFERAWIRFLGKYSYGIYVLHVFILSAMSLRLRAYLLGVTHSKLFAVAGAGFSCLVISVVVAYVSYHFYERPFLRFKHRFGYSKQSLDHGSPEDAFMEKTAR